MKDDKRPLWAKCVSCAHCWAVCYLPMDMVLAAQLIAQAKKCPRCGADGPTIAKQSDGALQEREAN